MYRNGSGSYPYDNQQGQAWGQSSYSDSQAQFGDPQNWYTNGASGESSRSAVPPPRHPGDPTNQLRHQSHASTNSLPSPDGSGSQEKNEKSAPKKKKRKTGTGDTGADGDDKEKRIKTGRACDACRTKKIRCDVLPSTTSPGGRESQQICAHCKQYDLECTWFLPITETRFKKRKTADEPAEAPFTLKPSATASPAAITPREVPTRTEGPTSLSFLLHTSLPASASEAYDLREHNRWEISEDGDGQLRVSAPPHLNGQEEEDLSRGYNRLARPTLNAATISALVNAYFDHVAPLFPVILRSDFAAKPNPSPLLLYSICGLGATRRQFPREIFAGVRGMINGLLRSNDILSDARFEHVQALLLIAQVGDLHAQPTAATASASLVRLASAIRMAQDLGLHRESSLRAQTAQDLAYVELRRRVWAACVILDRWYGAALGIPLMVDLLDCDVLLPAPYEIVPDSEPSSWRIDTSYLYLAEHLKLSILIGRVLKAIYSPTGLKHATDEQLRGIFADMTSWKQNLPNELKFKGAETPPAAGLLHMAHAALQFLFWRVFMRITYVVPSHLNFRLSVNDWTTMMNNSAEALQWLNANDTALDTVFIFAYTATSCALIQYHTWARRKDANALELLRLVKETATRWEVEVQPDQMSIRRKTCETMTLLHEAALKTNPELEEPEDRPAAVNPTPGVSMRQQVGKIAWIKDDTHPQGGFWLARSDEDRKGGGVLPTSVILLQDLDPNSEVAGKAYAALGVGQPTQQQNMAPAQSGPIQQPPTGNEPFGSGPVMQTPVDLQGMNNAVNVNPQINVEQGIQSFAQDPVIDLMSLTAPMSNNPLDLSSLDSLPMSSFDFPSWEQYFSAINAAVSPERDAFGQM